MRAAWITLFASLAVPSWALDLQQAYELALQHEPGWQAAQAQNRAAQELPVQARALLKPNIQFSASKSGVHSKDLNTNDGQKYPKHAINLSLRQTLFRKPQLANLDQAAAQVRQADADLERTSRELLVKVASAYVEALYADQSLATLQTQLISHAGQLTAAQRSFNAGEGARTDIDEAQARHDITQAQVLKARHQLAYAREQLAALIGQPVTELAPLSAKPWVRFEKTLADWLAQAEQNSPELQTLRASIDAAVQEVEKTRGAHYPTFDLTATAGRSESDTLNTFGQRYQYAQVGFELVIPLYSGGGVESAVRQALAKLDAERSSFQQAKLGLELAVRKEYQNLIEGRASLAALEVARKSAEQMRLGVEKGIQAGTRTQINRLDAIKQEADVERELALTRYQLVLAAIRLLALTEAKVEPMLAAVQP